MPQSWGYYQEFSRTIWINKAKHQACFPKMWRRALAMALVHELTHWAAGFFNRPYQSVYDVYKEELLAYRAQKVFAVLTGVPLVEDAVEVGAISSTASAIRQLKRGCYL